MGSAKVDHRASRSRAHHRRRHRIHRLQPGRRTGRRGPSAV